MEALEQRVEEAHRHWDQERIGGVEAKSKISIPSYLINLLGLPVEVYHPSEASRVRPMPSSP